MVSGVRKQGRVLATATVAKNRNFSDETKLIGRLVEWDSGIVELAFFGDGQIPDVIELDFGPDKQRLPLVHAN